MTEEGARPNQELNKEKSILVDMLLQMGTPISPDVLREKHFPPSVISEYQTRLTERNRPAVPAEPPEFLPPPPVEPVEVTPMDLDSNQVDKPAESVLPENWLNAPWPDVSQPPAKSTFLPWETPQEEITPVQPEENSDKPDLSIPEWLRHSAPSSEEQPGKFTVERKPAGNFLNFSQEVANDIKLTDNTVWFLNDSILPELVDNLGNRHIPPDSDHIEISFLRGTLGWSTARINDFAKTHRDVMTRSPNYDPILSQEDQPEDGPVHMSLRDLPVKPEDAGKADGEIDQLPVPPEPQPVDFSESSEYPPDYLHYRLDQVKKNIKRWLRYPHKLTEAERAKRRNVLRGVVVAELAGIAYFLPKGLVKFYHGVLEAHETEEQKLGKALVNLYGTTIKFKAEWDGVNPRFVYGQNVYRYQNGGLEGKNMALYFIKLGAETSISPIKDDQKLGKALINLHNEIGFPAKMEGVNPRFTINGITYKSSGGEDMGDKMKILFVPVKP